MTEGVYLHIMNITPITTIPIQSFLCLDVGCVFGQPQVYEKFVFTACKNQTVTKHVWFVTVGFLHAVNTNFSYTCGCSTCG